MLMTSVVDSECQWSVRLASQQLVIADPLLLIITGIGIGSRLGGGWEVGVDMGSIIMREVGIQRDDICVSDQWLLLRRCRNRRNCMMLLT